KLPWFRLSDNDRNNMVAAAADREVRDDISETATTEVCNEPPPPTGSRWMRALPILLLVCFAFLFVRMVFPQWLNFSANNEANLFVRSVNALSILAIPFLLSFFPLYAAVRGVKVYDEFVEGAKEGFGVILKIIPFLVTMLVAIGMFKGAGGIDLLSRALSPILSPLDFPTDLLPLALMRP